MPADSTKPTDAKASPASAQPNLIAPPKAQADPAKAPAPEQPETSATAAPNSPSVPTRNAFASGPAPRHRLPGASDLQRLVVARYGGKGGSIRVAAPPENSGRDAEPVKLQYVDADGYPDGEPEVWNPDEGSIASNR